MTDHSNADEKATASEKVKKGQFGALHINPDALGNAYEYIDDEENLKAKLWEKGGERRLYLRIRDREDGRKFNEWVVPLDGE